VSYNYDYEGEYRFRVSTVTPSLQAEGAESNDSVSSAGTLTLTTNGSDKTASVAGTIYSNADLDYYSLGTISSGQTIFLSTRKPAASNLDPIVGIYTSSNGYVTEAGSGRPFDGVAQVNITTTGTYYAVMRAGSGTGALNDSYVLDVDVAPTGSKDFPNLQVTAVTNPTGTIVSGQQVNFDFTVQNVGTKATGATSWSDRVVLSTDTILGNSDDLTLSPSTFSHTGALNAGDQYKATVSATLPDGISGDYYLIVQTDSNNQVNEFVLEGDNVTASTSTFHINLANYPDLTVENLSATAPDHNGAFTVTWNTANRGNKDVTGSWKERAVVTNLTTNQIVSDQTYDVSGPLAVGGTVAHSQSYTASTAGRYQVSVSTDSAGQIFEYNANGHADAEGNNTASTTLDATLDLKVGSLGVTPTSGVLSGGAVAINWNDVNAGNRDSGASFYDYITVVNSTLNKTLATIPVYYDASANGAIGAGASKSRSYTYTLPDGDDGTGHIVVTVKTDNNNNVAEYNTSGDAETNNSASASAACPSARRRRPPAPTSRSAGMTSTPATAPPRATGTTAWWS
jgi:hypothetical protein